MVDKFPWFISINICLFVCSEPIAEEGEGETEHAPSEDGEEVKLYLKEILV